jgi:hypothetical protein
MENPVRPEGAPASTSAADDFSPYLVSRDYEDHLDWLENQRNTRNKRTRRRAWFGALSGIAALAVSLSGVMMRKK